MSGPSDISERVTAIAAATDAASDWIAKHGAVLGQGDTKLSHDFRRYKRRSVKLQQAVQRPMCLAVFGASQAGKSYLVSRLAAAPGKQLTARFDRQTLDFLSDINPPGGQEATGLVTRFTTRLPVTPPGAPVALRLLSQTDIIKILANTYLEDFDTDAVPLDAAAQEAHFAALATRARPSPVDTLTKDDAEDLFDYFNEYFPSRKYPAMQQLETVGYWSRAIDLAPRLTIADRALLFAPLWGETKRFSELFTMLVNGLAALQFSDTAFCGIEGLVPRDNSLINVRRLFTIGQPHGPDDMLTVRTASGLRIDMSRPVLAALIAEMTVPLAEQPWPFFNETDLLDFPGARTREAITDPERFLAQPEKLGYALLRGKVAYLFQRYNAEKEITGMLLCVGPSNQEVQTLPKMVNDWIDQTVGRSPDARAKHPTSLFFVLTKFDAEFENKAGEATTSGTRWTARLQASLLDFFKSYAWPNEWVPNRPFNNLFWLRNPAVESTVFDYGPKPGQQRVAPEIGIAPRAASAVAERRSAYLNNPLVQRHIADPADAWDAAMVPNNGGIERLARALEPICDPALKASQIGARAEDLAVMMAESLRPLWRSNDKAAELAEAKARAGVIVRSLIDCARAQMFGALLRALQITAEQVAGIHWRMQTEPEEDGSPIGVVAGADEYADELSDLLGDIPVAAPDPGRFDYFDRFAGLVVASWDETLMTFAADTVALPHFKLAPDQAALLVSQIAAAGRRTDLRGRIATLLREHAGFHGRSATVSGKFVVIAEDVVNGFITFLGFDQMEEARRPAVGAGQRRIFAAKPTVRDLPVLGEQPSAYDRAFHVDWMAAFARMMEDNVSDRSAEVFDHHANDLLGAVVKRLEPEMAR